MLPGSLKPCSPDVLHAGPCCDPCRLQRVHGRALVYPVLAVLSSVPMRCLRSSGLWQAARRGCVLPSRAAEELPCVQPAAHGDWRGVCLLTWQRQSTRSAAQNSAAQAAARKGPKRASDARAATYHRRGMQAPGLEQSDAELLDLLLNDAPLLPQNGKRSTSALLCVALCSTDAARRHRAQEPESRPARLRGAAAVVQAG